MSRCLESVLKSGAGKRRFLSEKGNIGDLLSTGLCILAMTTVMLSFVKYTELIHRKSMVGQVARKYILRMETTGYLVPEDGEKMKTELAGLGVTQIDLSGTTRQNVGYGAPIALHISGKMEGEYFFEEVRVSTAKN